MDSFLKKAKMMAMMAAFMDPGIMAEPVYRPKMKKHDLNKPGPSKKVRDARKRQKQARKQNRKK